MFADDIIQELLAVGHHVAVREVVVGKTLLTGESGAFKNLEREVLKPTRVDLVGS